MEIQTPQTMKTLTKIRLINWHYFTNETISVKGSLLISGENATGKSTILDAIQLVLTTNTRRFNQAAYESRSKRDLKGYVRCKTGEEGNTYLRTGSVISYVALEFYEESKERFFVLGVKLESPDPDSEIKRKWFCENGSLDLFSFIVDNKPALDDRFKNNGKKIPFIQRTGEAKNIFKRRLGNLDDTFFDMIPKSLAFKPMDNVKSFINRYILPEREIDVDTLQENIRNLREMQGVLEKVKRQIEDLRQILGKYDEIKNTDKDILVIDILIKIAERESAGDKRAKTEKQLAKNKSELSACLTDLTSQKSELKSREDLLKSLDITITGNEHSRLIENLGNNLEKLENEKRHIEEKLRMLNTQIKYAISAIDASDDPEAFPSVREIRALGETATPPEERSDTARLLREAYDAKRDKLYRLIADIDNETRPIPDNLNRLNREINDLKKNKLTYPENTLCLKHAIEEELEKREISSDVRVFADLLEIDEQKWQNAVEGYLNTQRFYIIVEPCVYDIAAEVYDRVKSRIHSVGLINTAALDLDAKADKNSLAAVIRSENRYARAYSNYLMGRVIRCPRTEDLKKYPVAITDGCMLYRNKALRKIDADIYRVPYIGKYAFKRQLELKQAEKDGLEEKLRTLYPKKEKAWKSLELLKRCNADLIEENIASPDLLAEINGRIKKTSDELNEAKKDPTIIKLQMKRDDLSGQIDILKEKIEKLTKNQFSAERNIEDCKKEIVRYDADIAEKEKEVEKLASERAELRAEAEKKYSDHKRTKDAGTIADNYGPRKAALITRRGRLYGDLTALQSRFNDGELGTGEDEDVISAYEHEYAKLSGHDLINYEEKLEKAKSNCELEFRESFLAKMRENIEQADEIFKTLNKSLKSVRYGNDSYRFRLSANKLKQGLYEMITSDVNLGAMPLFSTIFEEKYHAEMEDLFSKLTASDDNGDSIMKEYTDYRSYLDNDIEVISENGKSQFFSKIHGEKSGGETQTPYYVVMAASFWRIYSLGESIRIIMLDEAFDKMDDDRIESMMKFFRSYNFQIILATPPSKMEIIGEHVDTILITYREGYQGMTEEYEL